MSNKILMRFIGKDDEMAGLKHGQPILVEEINGKYFNGYWGINRYGEEIFIALTEVIPYE